MKFNAKFYTMLLIILIGLNISSSNVMHTKKLHNIIEKAKIKTKLSSLEIAQTMFQRLYENVNSSKIDKISYFIMGIMANWFPNLRKIYFSSKNISMFFKPCESQIKTAWEMAHGTSKETNPSKIPDHFRKQNYIQTSIKKERNIIYEFQKVDYQTNFKNNKDICIKTKNLIHKIWKNALYTKFSSQSERKAFENSSSREKASKYCSLPMNIQFTNSRKLIIKEFETIENFKANCMKIREFQDCVEYTPDNQGIWYLLKYSIKFIKLIINCGECFINNLINGGGDPVNNIKRDDKIANLSKAALGNWNNVKAKFQELSHILMNKPNFNVAGNIRIKWLINKVNFQIQTMPMNFVFNVPYNIGFSIGQAIKIIKALSIYSKKNKK